MERAAQLAPVMLLQDDGGHAQAQEGASPKVSAVVLLDGDDAGQNPLVLFPGEKIKHAHLESPLSQRTECRHRHVCDVGAARWRSLFK